MLRAGLASSAAQPAAEPMAYPVLPEPDLRALLSDCRGYLQSYAHAAIDADRAVAAQHAPAGGLPTGWVAIPLRPTDDQWKKANAAPVQPHWDGETCLAQRVQMLVNITRQQWAAAVAEPARAGGDALPSEQLPDPLGCRACTHPDCGRFDGSQSVECAAMAFNSCARPDRAQSKEGGAAC